jgi:PAS domain S-box-containing protein
MAVARNSPDLIIVFDLDQRRHVYRNKSILDQLGYTEDESRSLEGREMADLLHPEDKPRFQAHLESLRLIPNHDVLSFEYRMRRAAGDGGWYCSRDTAFHRAANGRVTQFLSVTQDITQQRLLEAELRQSQKLEALGQLAGGVAHDFNNILTAQLMNLQLLLQEPGLSADIRVGLQDIQELVDRAAALTRQLLLFCSCSPTPATRRSRASIALKTIGRCDAIPSRLRPGRRGDGRRWRGCG